LIETISDSRIIGTGGVQSADLHPLLVANCSWSCHDKTIYHDKSILYAAQVIAISSKLPN